MGSVEGMSRGGGSSPDLCALEGVDDCDIEGSVLAASPVRNEDVGRLSLLAWQQKSSLLSWSKGSSHCCVMKNVP